MVRFMLEIEITIFHIQYGTHPCRKTFTENTSNKKNVRLTGRETLQLTFIQEFLIISVLPLEL